MATPQIGAFVRFRNGSSASIYPGWVQSVPVSTAVASNVVVMPSTDLVAPSTSVVLGSTDKRPRADITWTSYDHSGNRDGVCNLATALAVPQDDTLSSSFCFAIVAGGA